MARDERRRAERHAVGALKTRVEVGDGSNRVFEAWYRVINASQSGLFLEGGAFLKYGTQIRMFVQGAGGKELTCEGKVVRKSDFDDRSGMGVEFPWEQQRLLDELLRAQG